MRIKTIITIIAGFILAITSPFIAFAVNETPHNASKTVSCGNCHGKALLYSPFWGGSYTPANIDDTVYNKICLECHTKASGPYTSTEAPLARTHSSLATDAGYGNWTRECRDCHNPHYQKQSLFKRTDSSNLYLARGTITSCGAYNSVNNTTTLTYSGITYKSGWDSAKLLEKTESYRRTMLVPNVGKLSYNYPVKAIDATTITVEGNATEAYQYISPPTTFAVMYGQYVKDLINVSGTNKTVKFLDRTGTKSFADGDATYDGVCEVCHTLTTHFRNNGGGSDPNHANIGGAGGTNCISCHTHPEGFKASCNACHGYPPIVNSATSPDGLVWILPVTGSATAGAHNLHVNTKGYNCIVCHYNNTVESNKHNTDPRYITLGFYMFSGAYQGGSYDGQASPNYNATTTTPATTVSKLGAKKCSNLYCHGGTMAPNGGTAQAIWDVPASAACGTCHGATAGAPPQRGSHPKHAGSASGGRQLACTICHKGYTSVHVNGSANWSYDTTTYTWLSGALYKNSVSGSATPVPSTTYSQCSNLYCHSNVQTSPPGGALTYKTLSWGGSAPCGDCHKGNATSPNLMDSGSHTKHVSDYGARFKDCSTCHTGAGTNTIKHADHSIDVSISATYGGTYSGTSEPGNAYGGCSSNYCHSQGTSSTSPYPAPNQAPTWGNATTGECGDCHNYTKATPPGTGSHSKHVVSTGIYQYNCYKCHANVVNDVNPATISTSGFNTYHVNKTRDVSIDGGGNWNSPGASQCNNVYCHSNAKAGTAVNSYATPTWGGGALGCADCHSNPPAYASGAPGSATANSHVKHVSGSSIGCQKCHLQTTSNGSNIRTDVIPTKHVNANIQDVFFDTIGGKTGTYDTVAKTCSTTYCHGTGPSVAWGGSTQCNSCHDASNTGLSSRHDRHYNTATVPTTLTDPNAHAAAAYVYGCSNCHPTTLHAQGPVSGVQDANIDGTKISLANYTPALTNLTDAKGFKYTNYGTCTTVCHTRDGVSGAPVVAASWGGSFTGSCGVCHNKQGDASPVWSSPHTKHINTYSANTNMTCNACHSGTATDNSTINGATGRNQHPNAVKNVAFNAWAGGSWSGTQCSNIYCHGNGTTLTPTVGPLSWSGTYTLCNECHGNASSLATGSHTKHLNSGSTCDDCHNATASGNTTIGNYANHVNKSVTINFNAASGTGSATYNTQNAGGANVYQKVIATAVGNCTSIICHSDGTSIYVGGTGSGNTVNWGLPGTCYNCHGNQVAYADYRRAAPLYASGSPKPNAHQLHIRANGSTQTDPQCANCHSSTTTTNTTITGAVHTNGAYNVTAGAPDYRLGSDVSSTGPVTVTYLFKDGGAGPSSCSTVSCHPTGITANKTVWSTSYSCTDCHNINMNNTSGYHHVMDATVMADRTYPTSAPTSSATDSNRKCTMCHVDHNIFSPMLNTNAALTQPRAMNLRTAIGTTPTTAAGYTNSDYATGGGICISCHTNERTKNATAQKSETGSTVTVAVTDAQYSASAHQYNIASTMTNGSTTFNSNCSKCHNAKNGETTTFQSSTNKFGTHDKTLRRLFASLGMTSPTDPEEEDFCYRCHSKTTDTNPGGGPAKGTAGRDYYGTAGATMTAAAEDIFTVMQLGTAGRAPSSTSTTDTLYFKPGAQESPAEPMPNAHQTGDTFQGGTWIGRSMSPFTSNTAYETKSQSTNVTGTRYWRMVTFTSPPVASAVSIPAGTWTIKLYARENNTSQNAYIRYMIYKWNSSDSLGTTIVAVGSHTTELDTTADPGALWTINLSGSAVSLAAGDKIGIDLVLDTRQGSTTSYTASYYYGQGAESNLLMPANVTFTYDDPGTPASGRHDVAQYSGKHKPSPTDETLAYISTNKHVECADCHNPHAAGATKHTKGTNAVSPVLASVSGATPTSWGTYGTTTSPTLYLRNNAAINAVPPTRPGAYKYSSGTYTTNTFNDRDMAPTSGATTASTNISTGSTAARYDRGLQFVSPQIDQAVTIPSGSTFTLTIRESRSFGTSTDYTRFTVYKWDGTTATPLNTSAAPNNYGQNAIAISTTATNRSTTFTSNQAVTLNPGDSLICDVEFYHSAGTTPLNVTYAYGNFGTDAAALALPAGTYVWRTSPGGNWTAPSSYTLQTSTYEYQICFKCHSGANTNYASWGGIDAASWTDVGLEFSPNNRSGHPIVTGLNNYPNSLPPKALVAAQMLAPWNVNLGTQTMYCTDCHETDSVASKGPHASAVKWMLAGANKAWPYQGAANNGGSTGTYWTLSNRNTNSGTANGLFCLNCHPVTDTNDAHSDSNHNSYKCVDCHIRVPHGGKVSRLISTQQAGYGMPARYFPDGKGGGVGSDPMGKFTKASSRTGYDTSSCDANCHGSHSNSTGESW